MDFRLKIFTEFGLINVRKDMEKALKEVEEKYGITFDIGNMNYGHDNFSVKVTAAIGNEDAKTVKFKKDFIDYCSQLGMSESDLGKKVTMKGVDFTIVGLKTRSRLNIVLASKNELVSATHEYVKELLNAKV